MRKRVRIQGLVPAVLALSVVSIASAATVWAAAGHRHHRRKHRPTPVFMISGKLGGSLRLGAAGAQPLNLWITNRRGRRLIVSHIQVSVSAVRQPSGARGACAQSGPDSPNFSVTNLPPGYRLTVPAHATRSLTELGQHLEPVIAWLDQPWVQNGCLGSTITFSYHARGRYAQRRGRTRGHRR